MFKGLLGGKGLSPEEQDAVAMMSQMVDGKAQIQIGVGPDGKAMMKDLTAVGKDDLQRVLNDKKSAKEAASQATGIMERIQNVMNQLMVAVYPLFHALEQNLQPLVDILKEKTTGWAESLKNFFTKVDISGSIDGLKNFFVGLGEKLKFVAENWKTVLGVAAIAFATYWVGQQVIAGLTFGLTAGKAFMMSAGGGLKNLFGSVTSKLPGGGGTPMTGAQMAMQGQAAKAAGMGSMMKSLGSSVQILAVGAALMMVAKALDIFGDAMLKLQKVPTGLLVGVGTGLLVFVGAMGLLGASGIGEIGVAIMLGVGAALLMIGGAVWVVAQGMSTLVDSFTNLFTILPNAGSQLLDAGLGFLSMAVGIGVLTLSLIAMGAAAIFALPGLLILGGVTSMLTETATALAASGGGEGIEKAVNAINSVDQNKLDALKDLSMWFSLIGASPTIKFEENLTVDGSIVLKGEAGGKTGTDWIKDPIFVSKLKELIEYSNSADRNGGKPR